jgi:cyclase
MKIIDLSAPIDAAGWEPEPVTMRTMSPREGAEHCSAEMRAHFGLALDPDVFPGGEFLSNDYLSLTTHTGTHVDAPAHYGSTGVYGAPRTIDEMPLDWFLQPGVLLDLREVPTGAVDAAHLEEELARVGHTLAPLDIVLLQTGASAWAGTPRYFTDFVGLDATATNFLLDAGVRVIGTDAFSLDAPFVHIIEQYQRTGEQAVLWPAHMAGRQREFCQLERLANLDALPRRRGFMVSCFPVKIARAGAGWARAVALIDD